MQRWQPKSSASKMVPPKDADPLEYARDPYARWQFWSGARSGANETSEGSPTFIRVLGCAKNPGPFFEAAAKAGWEIPPVYREPVVAGGVLAHYFTAKVPLGEAFKEARELLFHAELEWELAIPLRDTELTARADRLGEFGATRDTPFSEPFKAICEVPPSANSGRKGTQRLTRAMAVIDFGCPILNQRFCSGPWTAKAKSRIAALWDQGANAGKPGYTTPWSLAAPPSMKYGRELLGNTINELIGAVRSTPPDQAIDELDAYKAMDYLIDYDDPRRRAWGATHGAHVLDVAGGSCDPVNGKDTGAASRAPLIFVQLPSLTAADSSGGSLSAQLLDAVRYILRLCRDEAPVVINISYGTFAGPHDGSSMIEKALDQLLDLRDKNFAIVLAAGNARQAGCHARRTVSRKNSALLRIDLAANDTTDTFTEIWYGKAPAGLELKVRVRNAERQWSKWTAPEEMVLLNETSVGEPVAMVAHQQSVPNGDKSLILIAMRPTRPPMGDDGPAANAGRWEVEICLVASPDQAVQAPADGEVTIDAWIERDDPGDSDMSGQTSFAGMQWQDADETLSSLATGQHTVVVGGFRQSDELPAPYSSTGTRKADTSSQSAGKSLFVHAVCEEDEDRPGLRAAAVRSNASFVMNGTSVAAPVVARRLFDWMIKRTTEKGPVQRGEWPSALAEIVANEHAAGGNRAVKASA